MTNKLTFTWSERNEEARASPTQATSLLLCDAIYALDFLDDIESQVNILRGLIHTRMEQRVEEHLASKLASENLAPEKVIVVDFGRPKDKPN